MRIFLPDDDCFTIFEFFCTVGCFSPLAFISFALPTAAPLPPLGLLPRPLPPVLDFPGGSLDSLDSALASACFPSSFVPGGQISKRGGEGGDGERGTGGNGNKD